MALFGIGKKSKPATKPAPAQPTFALTVPHTKNYRGFKRLNLATYKGPYAEAGIRFVKGSDIREISFEEYIYPDTPPLMRVYADGNQIGTIWSASWSDYYDAIRRGRCTKASVSFTDSGDVMLFIKID
jgi:hypothetical protein